MCEWRTVETVELRRVVALVPLRINRCVELSALNKVVQVANDRFARDAKFSGEVRDVRTFLGIAQSFQQLILTGEPFSETALGFVALNFFGALKGLQRTNGFGKTAFIERSFDGRFQF